MENKQATQLLFLAWLFATLATLGSLFFSEIMGFVPCTLCWYQRICLYPVAIILLVAFYRNEQHFFHYSVPLLVIGWLIALYHNLIQLEIIPESASPCIQGVPCSMKYIEWLGFITIPLLSFFAFTVLLLLITVFYRRFYHEQ